MAYTYSDVSIRAGRPAYSGQNQPVNLASADDKDAADFARILQNPHYAPAATATSAAAAQHGGKSSWTSFFKGLVDVINPLQHIPIVSAIYRHITGDEISPTAHFIGDALYGGVIGGAVAATDIAYQKTTGKDIGETVIASLSGGSKSAPGAAPDVMLARQMNKITPAAGGDATPPSGTQVASADNADAHRRIIWTSESPLFPPSQPTGTRKEEPSSPSLSAQTASQTKVAASTSLLQAQEAPVGTSRKSVPPELIASRMMEGLQKYADMKANGLMPAVAAAEPNISAYY